jgi:5-methyltetrahydropteroyltriglutamate--homocysteine methyltransferase
VVRGVVGPGSLDLESEWRQAARLTARPLKFTVTSPYMMAKLLHDVCYGDFAQLLDALAGVLADQVDRVAAAVVQIDEPNLPGSPQDALLAARAINRVLDRVSGEGAVHLCFGNFGGQRIQRGDYPSLLGFFNALHCRHLVLETTRRPAAELEILGEIRPEIGLGLGVIDVKDLQVETPEEVARRIERLAGAFGVERIRYVHPDCGLAHLPRDVADGKLRALVAGRDQFLGQRRSLDAALSGGR